MMATFVKLKEVRFSDNEIIHDHLCIQDMLSYDVFWTKEDCQRFHKEALYEMKKCKMKYQCVSIKQIMKLLHQPDQVRPPRIDGGFDNPNVDILEEIAREIGVEKHNFANVVPESTSVKLQGVKEEFSRGKAVLLMVASGLYMITSNFRFEILFFLIWGVFQLLLSQASKSPLPQSATIAATNQNEFNQYVFPYVSLSLKVEGARGFQDRISNEVVVDMLNSSKVLFELSVSTLVHVLSGKFSNKQ